MRVVLFDLGNTLVDASDVPLPGALEMLEAVAAIEIEDGTNPILGLLSDFTLAPSPAQIPQIRQEYREILERAGLIRFFEPFEERVTLSTDLGVFKPEPALFRAAVSKLDPEGHLHHAVFVTENGEHIAAARALGMMAIHFKAPGQTEGEVDNLLDLVPLIQRIVTFSPCCKKRGEAAGRFASQSNRSKRQDSQITGIVDRIDPQRLSQSLDALAGFGTRWTYSDAVTGVPDWIHRQFADMGYDPTGTIFQPFSMPGGITQRNVLCGPLDDDAGYILVCAHYDSLSEQAATLAPGADDNASGIAVMLEAARILRTAPEGQRVRYAAFGGEEQGLFGSQECAEIAHDEGWPIDLVINLDMLGFQDPARPGHTVVEYDQGNRNPTNDAASKAFGLLMAQAAADYTDLTVEHTDIWNSDYIPFEAKGYACIGVFEAAENPFYHQSTDTVATLDPAHLAEITRMLVATICTING